MTSIYQRAMGPEFERLHPKLQERFRLSAEGGLICIASGVMERVWRGGDYLLPLLPLGALRNVALAAEGENVPFQLVMYPYRDSFGREAMSWIRTFHFARRQRRFDTTMIYSDARRCLVDYLGTHANLAADVQASASAEGGLILRSGAQRFYEGPIALPLPELFSGYGDVYEWYDEVAQIFRIRVIISNPKWGKLFGYTGYFNVEYRPLAAIPSDGKPLREERRE
jgi:hypothetical protein